MRVALVIASLSGVGGGMERSATMLAGSLAEAGHDVCLLTLDSPEAVPLYTLGQGIALQQLDFLYPASCKIGAVRRMFRSARAVRRSLVRFRPDAVVAFGDHTCVLTLAGCLGTGMPVIVAERTHPAHYHIGRGWGGLRRLLYPRAAALVAQTRDIARWYAEHLDPVRVEVIPNAALPCTVRARTGQTQGRTVAAAGLLAPVKQFEALIEAFSSVAGEHPDWKLVIYGEGPDRAKLEGLVADLGIEERVSLPGRVERLQEHLAGADLFVLTSRTEGFPNVMLEAMAVGLPAVAFDCPSGPSEIIRHGEDGYLVPAGDVRGLAQRLGELMADDAKRERFAQLAGDIVERFSRKDIVEKWERLIRRVAA